MCWGRVASHCREVWRHVHVRAHVSGERFLSQELEPGCCLHGILVLKKKKITIGQRGTEKVQNEKRPLDSQNSVSEKQTVTFQGKGRKTQN